MMREQFGNVRFDVLIQGNENVYPGWKPNIRQVKRMIPGSGLMARQLMGKGPSAISLRLELDSFDDYMALQAMLGRTSTLVLRSRFTNARGTTLYEDGVAWEYLDWTTLDDLSEPFYEIAGAVEATATFERAFDTGNGRAG